MAKGVQGGEGELDPHSLEALGTRSPRRRELLRDVRRLPQNREIGDVVMENVGWLGSEELGD